jgi:RNA:NAD 2'-phosphotransferase (TPT1/KptA family)
MKILTVIKNTPMGWFEDSCGFVGARKLRKEYATATKALHRALLNAVKNHNPERQPALEAEIVKAQEAFSLAEKAVVEYSS